MSLPDVQQSRMPDLGDEKWKKFGRALGLEQELQGEARRLTEQAVEAAAIDAYFAGRQRGYGEAKGSIKQNGQTRDGTPISAVRQAIGDLLAAYDAALSDATAKQVLEQYDVAGADGYHASLTEAVDALRLHRSRIERFFRESPPQPFVSLVVGLAKAFEAATGKPPPLVTRPTPRSDQFVAFVREVEESLPRHIPKQWRVLVGKDTDDAAWRLAIYNTRKKARAMKAAREAEK